MHYAEFVDHLTRHPDLELVFELGDITIRRDYHLTEVLRLTVDAIDCGGAVDNWQETVLQLVEPGHSQGQRFMSAGKAAGILQRSQARIALHAASEVVLEFRSDDAPAAQRYRVTGIAPQGSNQLRVRSEGARTQCKAAERSHGAGDATSASAKCCSPGAVPVPAAGNKGCCSNADIARPAGNSRGCCA